MQTNMNGNSFSVRPFFNSIFAIAVALTTAQAFAQEIPWASSAEEVGMSSERLERINQVMQRHIEAGNIQGAVTAVARRGKIVHFEAAIEGSFAKFRVS